MKALSLWQPWASLVAVGAKQIETRSWAPSYRGPLAIHAAKRWDTDLIALCQAEPFRSVLLQHGLMTITSTDRVRFNLPFGAVVATATLRACVLTNYCTQFPWWPGYAAPHELAFGDYTPGRYAWLLRDVQALAVPIPARGGQQLWEWEPGQTVPRLF